MIMTDDFPIPLLNSFAGITNTRLRVRNILKRLDYAYVLWDRDTFTRDMFMNDVYADISTMTWHEKRIIFNELFERDAKFMETVVRRIFTVGDIYEIAGDSARKIINDRFLPIYVKMGCDINHLIRGEETLLHLTIDPAFDMKEEAFLLLEHGASVDIKNHQGMTPLEALHAMNDHYYDDLLGAMDAAHVPFPDVKVAERN